ncbi:KilA-N domain-containing protein [Dysgonomonas sp. 521]|uniref:KilA-N domain-containing protein n=1 Tax=Dysgonomonas sp. 521 TaxID=2302932 RepID=UPI0013D2A7C4|nr:KilA-N domain-containing protein [Dysgonomonas sp. 521]NDV96462.1 KilA-N domain-containing protein [Dysgonomonas sp. 521]
MIPKIFIFNDTPITFVFNKDNTVMINATEMAKVFDAEVAHFMENQSTKKFIESCLKTRNSEFLKIKSKEDLVLSRQKSGTFMHRILAIKFAAWLDSDFEVWVYSTIEKLLFGKHAEREQSFKRTIELQKEMNLLVEKSEKTGGDFDRYLEINRELRKEKAIRKSLTKDSINEMGDLFDDEDEDNDND